MRTKLLDKITPLVLLFALFIAGKSHSASIIPVGDQEYDFVYDWLERNEALSMDRFDYQLGPYSVNKNNSTNSLSANLTDIGSNELRLFGFAGESFRSSSAFRGSALESMRAGIVATPHPNLFIYGSFILDEALANKPSYSGKVWRGLAGDVRDAFAHYGKGRLSVMVGRFSSFWGIRESLVLSPQQKMDGFAYTFRWGKLSASYRLARLDGLSPSNGSDSVTFFENRYLAAHRLDLHISPNVRLGLFESVVFGGPGRQVDLFYLNPLIFFHGAQLNEATDDNTFLGFDFTIKPRRGLKLYGQLMVDDYQIEKKSQGDQEPNEFALTAGAYLADFFESLDLRTQYTRVTNRTFNQILTRNRYLHNGLPIGSATGNDYDLFELDVIRWFGPDLSLSALFSYYRQGEGKVSDQWSKPWLDLTGDYSEPFPTGVVSKRLQAGIEVTSILKNLTFVSLGTGFERSLNDGHISGNNRTDLYFNLLISFFAFSGIDLK